MSDQSVMIADSDHPEWGAAGSMYVWTKGIYLIKREDGSIAVMKLCKGHCRILATLGTFKDFTDWYNANKASIG